MMSGHKAIRGAFALLIGSTVLLGAEDGVCAEPAYPNRPIRMIIPFAPGGSNDVMGRILGQKLTDAFGVYIVVDNRGGGSGVIGTEAVAKAVPDGYTILVTSINAHLTTPLVTRTPYDPVTSFAPIATIDASEYMMVVHPSLAANTLQELIALAKAKPGQINCASTSTFLHLTTALFALRTGIKIQNIPYKGAGPAINDLLGGHVQMFFSTSSSMIAHVRGNRLRPLAITGERRLPALPQVPTFAEAGVRDFQTTALRGVLAPPKTPQAIVDRLSREIGRIVALPEIAEKIDAQGMTPFFLSSEQLGERMRADSLRFAQTVKAMPAGAI